MGQRPYIKQQYQQPIKNYFEEVHFPTFKHDETGQNQGFDNCRLRVELSTFNGHLHVSEFLDWL